MSDKTHSGARLQAQLVMHAGWIIVIGLLSGFGLLFALLEEIRIWPLPGIPGWEIPGTVRGWSAAHVGGILNGVMMIAVAVALPIARMTERGERRVLWAMVFTGWANTIFYQFGNLAPNRGLSGDANVQGDATLAGLIAYLPAAIATVVTSAAVVAVALAATRRARELK